MNPETKTPANILFLNTVHFTGALFALVSSTAMADTTLNAPLVLTTPADLGAITRTADGATLTLSGSPYLTSNSDTNGILGGWAVINNGSTYSWAHVDSGTISAAATTTRGTSFSGNHSTFNWINSDGNTTLTGATQVNSFVSANDVTISGLLTIGSGGMILGNNASKWIKNGTGGQITSGLASGELFVYTPNTGATDMRIQVQIVNNGGTPVDLVKGGAGRLDLEAANTYTGATILNGGSLYLRNASALGSTSQVAVNGDVGVNLSANVTTSAVFTGSGTLNTGTVDGGASWNITGDLSGFQGAVTYQSGTNGRNNLNLGGATDSSMDLSNARIVLSGPTSGGARALRLGGAGPGGIFKVGDLSGAGQLNVNNGLALQVGALGLSNTFSGKIQGSDGVATTASVTKVGTGTWTLTGAQNYTGATNINAGKLLVNGSTATGSAVTVSAGTLTATPVASLGGTGTIGGNLTVSAESATGFKNGGILAPTASASGTALGVTGTTTFNTGSIFEWDLNAVTTDPGNGATNNGNYGQLAGTGAITGSDAVFQIVLGSNTFSDAFWNTDKSWNNISTGNGATTNLTSIFSGGFSGSGVDAAGVVAGRGSFTFSGASTLTWSAVPEPGSAMAGFLVVAGLLRRRRCCCC